MASILVIDDDSSMRKTLSMLLKSEGYQVEEAREGSEGINKIEKKIYDLVITDLKMYEVDGLQVLRACRESNPDTEVIVMTAYGTIETAKEAIKLGAYDYLTTPCELDDILLAVSKALERKKLIEENKLLRHAIGRQYNFKEIVGTSSNLQNILRILEKVSTLDSTILILGESGTGKELVARALHSNSLRVRKPLVAINCANLPESLLNSELFGHMKGSFTGAISNKKGLFEEAHQGTIFLDEIGDITASIQASLLRVLQEQTIRRVGSNEWIKIDVRVIACTNKNLEEAVKKGLFRDDLYYRLNVIPITMPPLRERESDIPLLTKHFLAKHRAALGKQVDAISPEAMQIIKTYNWPGNIRQLENALEHAVALVTGNTIRPEDLPDEIRKRRTDLEDLTSNKLSLKDIEKMVIQDRLQKHNWNQTKVARELQIGQNTLWRKIKKYRLKSPLESELES